MSEKEGKCYTQRVKKVKKGEGVMWSARKTDGVRGEGKAVRRV